LPFTVQERDVVSVLSSASSELDGFLSSINPIEDLFLGQESGHAGFSNLQETILP
jgi:hypothetical protein